MKPVIKWAGGKTQLVTKLINKIPTYILNNLQSISKQNKYIEPFLGSGAMLFALTPQRAIANDINRALINMYNVISYSPKELINLINTYDTNITSQKYYSLRDIFNNKLCNNEYDIELAALFIFLNKHGFNGLYRVNAKNRFNVPFNKSTRPSINTNNIQQISAYLAHIQLYCTDFINVTSLASKDDLIFIDSPYPPIRDKTFAEYNAIKFIDADHIRLAHEINRLHNIGVYIIATNHDTPLIRKLYNRFNIEKVSVQRNINSNGNNRKSEEIIITNF